MKCQCCRKEKPVYMWYVNMFVMYMCAECIRNFEDAPMEDVREHEDQIPWNHLDKEGF